MARKKALVICPGRGTYNKDELGYLARFHSSKLELMEQFDRQRMRLSQVPLSDLDRAEKFITSVHTRGDNASPLIYTCAYADFLAINRDEYEIVAITGNSMGWYIALACGGALDPLGGFEVVNTMGRLMQKSLIGGQIIYPFVDENWVEISGRKSELLALTEEIPELHLSILLGGMIVFAGEHKALDTLEGRLPSVMGRFPMRLQNHAAFHSPLQQPISRQGFELLPNQLFGDCDVPLIDGRGHIWYPGLFEAENLRDYTLGDQVVTPYDFSKAIRNGLHEFAPDVLIILGPGTTLGGSVAQCLIANRWQEIDDRKSFMDRQSHDPFILSMGMAEQRQKAIVSS